MRKILHYFPQTGKSSLLLLLIIVLSSSVVQAANLNAENVPDATSKVYLPIVPNNRCSRLQPQTLFGLQMYGSTSNKSTYFADLIASEASWVRVELSWEGIEPANTTPDKFKWSGSDQTLAAARDGCINVIGTFARAPSWAASYITGPIDRAPLSELGEVVGALAERYDGDGIQDAPGSPVVNYWEMYNEPDSLAPRPDQPSWATHGKEYADMLAVAYPAIKAANPKAQVLFAGIAYDAFQDQGGQFVRSFVDDVLNAGGGNYFDIMNFHVYPAFAKNWTNTGGTGVVEKAAVLRSKLSEHGLTKPFFITEMGWHNNNVADNPSSNEVQSRYVVKLYISSLAADVKMATWWTLADVGNGYPYNMGLVTNGTPPVRKDAFAVYTLLSREIKTAIYERSWSAGETQSAAAEVHQFTDAANNRKLYVAWINPVDTGNTHNISVSGASATVRDIYGTSSVVTDGADGRVDGVLTIAISARPLYIEVGN